MFDPRFQVMLSISDAHRPWWFQRAGLNAMT